MIQEYLDLGHAEPVTSDSVTNLPNEHYAWSAGADLPEEEYQLFLQLRQLLLKGGFNLRKWRCSSSEVLEKIEPELREKIPVKDLLNEKAAQHPKGMELLFRCRLCFCFHSH